MNEVKGKPTLADVYQLVTDPEFKDADGSIVYEMAMLGGPARSAAAMISQMDGETLGTMLLNANQSLDWLESEPRREGFGHSDFSPLDLNKKKVAVFYVEPVEELSSNARPLRIVTSMFISGAMKGRKVRGKGATLFIIDEAYALDRLDLLVKRVAVMRKQGARAWVTWTNKGQVEELYGKNAETFFANAAQVQVFAINDVEGAEYISRRIGNWVRWSTRKVRTKDGEQEELVPSASCNFRDGPEINRTTGRAGRLQIVLNEGGDPFLLRRTSYQKMFKRDQYGRDPYEPQRESLREKAWGLLLLAQKKVLEWMS
jgi:type IV secretory pathway TraG/TraD family ATPase VirD4